MSDATAIKSLASLNSLTEIKTQIKRLFCSWKLKYNWKWKPQTQKRLLNNSKVFILTSLSAWSQQDQWWAMGKATPIVSQ